MANCEYQSACPYGSRCEKPKLPEYINPNVQVLIVKSLPSDKCNETGNLFGEESDTKTLFQAMKLSGLMDNPSIVGFSSVIRCGVNKYDKTLFSTKNTKLSIAECGKHMENTLAKLPNLKVIVPLGAEARDYFCQDKLTITKSLGRKYTKNYGFGDVYVIPNMSPAGVHHNPDMHNAKFLQHFKKINRVLNDQTNSAKYKTKYLTYPQFADYAARLLEYHKTGQIVDVAFDIETSVPYRTSKDGSVADIQEASEYITGFSLADSVERVGYYINLRHPKFTERHGEDHAAWEERETRKIILELLHTIPFYCHNGKYDISWMYKKLQLDLNQITYATDTLVLGYLLLGVKRDTGIALSLKSLCKMYFEVDDEWDEPVEIELAKFNRIMDRRLTNISFTVLSQYAGMDAIAMLHLKEYFMKMLSMPQNEVMKWPHNLLIKAIVSFVRIESHGVPLHLDMLRYLDVEYRKHVKAVHRKFINLPSTKDYIEKKVKEKYPDNPEKVEQGILDYDMSVGGNDVKEYVFSFLRCPVKFTTPKGEPSLNKDAKEYLANNAPHEFQREAIRLISEEIEVGNQLSKYINTLKSHASRYNGKYFPSYNLTTVTTGRLSSDFHTMPSFGDIKYSFISEWADIGGLVLAPDYSQVEVRVFASLSGDPDLKQAYIDGLDIHKFVASNSFHVSYEDVTKLQRSRAKAVIFGMLYGESVWTLAGNLGIEEKEAQGIQDAIFHRFPKIKIWIDRTIKLGESQGYVDSALGRRRQLPALKAHKYSKARSRERKLYSAALRAAMNHPVQSTASDVTLSSVVAIEEELVARKYFSHFIGTVHDSMEFSIHPAEIIEMMLMIKDKCEDDLINRFSWLNGVPYRMDIEGGFSWGNCADFEIESHDPEKGITVLEVAGRDIAVKQINRQFQLNPYFDISLLEETKEEEPMEIDTTRAFNGLIYKTSTHKMTQKILIKKKAA